MKKISLLMFSLFIAPSLFAAEHTIDTANSSLVWKGEKITGSNHTGNIDIKEGRLDIKKNKLQGGSFVIDMNSIKNQDLDKQKDKDKLVGHLKSDDFFSVETYPTASFTITQVKAKKDNVYTFTGDLTIRDKTKSISFDATMVKKDGVYVATADIAFNRADYDVKYNSETFFSAKKLGDKLIKNDIQLNVSLTTQK